MMPALLFEKWHSRVFGRGEIGDEHGDAELSLPQRVRSLRGIRCRARGVVRELARAAQPFFCAALFVEIEQRVGAAGGAAAEARVGARLVPRVPCRELRELQPLRVAEQSMCEREEEDLARTAVAPAGGHCFPPRPTRTAALDDLQTRNLA